MILTKIFDLLGGVLRRYRCGRDYGHDMKFCRNFYGDEIFAENMMRSLWKCERCGAYRTRPELQPEPPDSEISLMIAQAMQAVG